MYSEPTISPNFVVRQKRKLSRHPLVIGCIILFVTLVLFAIFSLLSSITSSLDNQTVNPASVSVRIVAEETPAIAVVVPTSEPTPVPEIINIAHTISNDTNTPSALLVETVTACSIRPSGDINVNIRSGPDIQFSLLSTLPVRQTVSAIAVSDNRWFQIENNDGTIGWVGGSVVDEIGDCEGLPQVQTPVCDVRNTTGNRVNIRAEASTDSPVIRILSTEDILMADGQTADGWYRILMTGELGWIYRDVVALSDACNAVALISANEPTPQPAVTTNLVFSEDACVVESFTGNAVDLFAQPNFDAAVVAKLNKAMQASQVSTNGWYEIDGFGWAFAGDIVTQGLCRLLPTVAPEDIR